MGTKNITREQRAHLLGKLELITHAIEPGTVITEDMAEVIIDTLMETRGVIKKHPIKLNRP